ncbi:hypothetical protein WICPIJ_002173 [Wickerhamomyces pijperi]|uniref:Uncharacterized protein n=1 Tax=Wickerhamomyces pijperi TaxID=599730 RepID=A0A9P8QAB6_WICPI|nr:hypothetical protein WICPIJ_002173 [Wickerhamomyces pijperi]
MEYTRFWFEFLDVGLPVKILKMDMAICSVSKGDCSSFKMVTRRGITSREFKTQMLEKYSSLNSVRRLLSIGDGM